MRVVFAGPSLFGAPASAFEDLCRRPPAQCGDVLAAVEEGASAIGLIDGYFEVRRSPWHKEILWALSNGIPVLGAASLGALRAAEMAPLGMKPVGMIARLFSRGVLIDDDEVAVLHGPEETGFLPLTEPLANIRFNLRRARRLGVISRTVEDRAVKVARSIFYKERTYDALLERLKPECSAPAIAALRHSLAVSRRDLKHEDALSLLACLRAGPKPPHPRPRFAGTRFWRDFLAERSERPKQVRRSPGATRVRT